MRLDTWLSSDERDIEREARALAARWPAHQVRFCSVRTFDYAGQPARSVVFDVGGSEFALVPAGSYAIGFDVGGYDADRDVRRSYAEAVRGVGFPRELAAYLGRVLAPPSRVDVPAMLVEVTARRAGYVPVATDDPRIAKLLARIRVRGSYEEAGRFRIEERAGGYAAWVIRATSRDSLVQGLAATGFRLPAAHQWEVACSAGRQTLFRWGTTCPLDRTPVDEVIYNPSVASLVTRFTLHVAPNAWGLHIAEDPYKAELVAEPDMLRGGDGGEAACGDYGAFLTWLPLASAYASAEQSRPLLQGDVTGHWYRRVLDVP
jgi:hypothetical protein